MVRDAVDGETIRVQYVKSGEQHADVLTNAIDATKSFEKHARFLLNVRYLKLSHVFFVYGLLSRRWCLKTNQNAPRPSEHTPVRGGKCQNV